MTSRDDLRPARRAAPSYTLTRVERPSPEFARFLFTAVGWPWKWYSRLSWDYARWHTHLERPGVEMWVAYVAGAPAGYFELVAEGPDVEIAFFGLLPAFIGQGLGGVLLTAAVERAWRMGPTARVWLHTCDLDHPQALAAYQARGFRVYRSEQQDESVPAGPFEPWPGARMPGSKSAIS
ncbi:MAG: GNAT family N-acetyltransferase [Acidobacteriota bacterium]